ncbi:MAG TPA: hypothetical protein DEP38_09220, partial [Cyanobacteria bacterium UBA9226]|nr:hypothetical protein [Cyanobacteria bacterium UBA9226]
MSIFKLSLALLSLTSSLIFSGSRLINPTPVSGTQTEFAENLQPPQQKQSNGKPPPTISQKPPSTYHQHQAEIPSLPP